MEGLARGLQNVIVQFPHSPPPPPSLETLLSDHPVAPVEDPLSEARSFLKDNEEPTGGEEANSEAGTTSAIRRCPGYSSVRFPTLSGFYPCDSRLQTLLTA